MQCNLAKEEQVASNKDDDCNCAVCQARRNPNAPLEVRKLLDHMAMMLVQHAPEGKALLGFDPEDLQRIGLAIVPGPDGNPTTLGLYAEPQRDGRWRVWADGNQISFEGSCLTGHGWRRRGSVGVYCKPGILVVSIGGRKTQLHLD